MKYRDIVQDLADRGQNCQFYDENFRFLRQTQRSSLSWADVHWELWLRSQHTSQKLPSTMQRALSTLSGKGPQNSIPRGYCFKFHKGEACSGANLNIPVLSVTVYTLALNVIFVANLGEIFPDQPVILPSQVLLPMPINLNRLEPYLNGYFADIISTLISGFTNILRYIFLVLLIPKKAKICLRL
jgi:hypothetical protein